VKHVREVESDNGVIFLEGMPDPSCVHDWVLQEYYTLERSGKEYTLHECQYCEAERLTPIQHTQ
jgi:hypothetical protein